MPITDRHIVVTGGTGALGSAVVERLIGAGAICHIPNLIQDELQHFAHADNARVRIVPGIDLTDDELVTGFYHDIPALWASVHIAGGFDMSPIAETSKDAFLHQLHMNALTSFLCCREAVKAIRRTNSSGSPDIGGRIVNVSARPALEPRAGAGMVPYTAAKAAVAALTRSLAEEVASESILVNAIVPSIIDTKQNRADMPDADHAAWPKPAEIAETVAFLVSDENTLTRGGLIPVYGAS